MSFVLELQNTPAAEQVDAKSPSTWSNWACYSTGSVILCAVSPE